jgi:hypothetical protein
MNKKVISILSTGHSGSTLLDIILGSIPEVFSMGEVRHLPYQFYRNLQPERLNQDLCTCGAPFRECSVWGPVVEAMSTQYGDDFSAHPERLRMRLIGNMYYKHPVNFVNKVHRELICRFAAIGHLRIAQLLCSPFDSRTQLNWDVFKHVFDVTGSRAIVDSTKDIVRFFALSQIDDIETIPVVLIRDARGVASSAVKYGLRPQVALDSWIKHYNLRIFPILREMGKDYIFVDYAEMTRNPQGIRRIVADRLGLEYSDCPDVFRMKNYHLSAGNPMRYNPEISIRHDDSWKKRLTPDLLKMADAAQSKLQVQFENTK